MEDSKIKDIKDVKERLIQATLKLLEAEDCEQISIREIAHLAGVNSAAISYHFGGKGALLEKAMSIHSQGLLKIFTDLLEERSIDRVRIEAFVTELMEYLLKYEGAYRTGRQLEIIRKSQGEQQGGNLDFTGTQFKALAYMLHSVLPERSEEVLQMKAVQFFSSIAYPIIYIDLYDAIKSNLSLEDFKKQYIKLIVDTLLA